MPGSRRKPPRTSRLASNWRVSWAAPSASPANRTATAARKGRPAARLPTSWPCAGWEMAVSATTASGGSSAIFGRRTAVASQAPAKPMMANTTTSNGRQPGSNGIGGRSTRPLRTAVPSNSPGLRPLLPGMALSPPTPIATGRSRSWRTGRPVRRRNTRYTQPTPRSAPASAKSRAAHDPKMPPVIAAAAVALRPATARARPDGRGRSSGRAAGGPASSGGPWAGSGGTSTGGRSRTVLTGGLPRPLGGRRRRAGRRAGSR